MHCKYSGDQFEPIRLEIEGAATIGNLDEVKSILARVVSDKTTTADLNGWLLRGCSRASYNGHVAVCEFFLKFGIKHGLRLDQLKHALSFSFVNGSIVRDSRIVALILNFVMPRTTSLDL